MVSRKKSALSFGLIVTQVVTLFGAGLPLGVPQAQADNTPIASLPGGGLANYSPFNPSGSPVNFQVAQAQSFANLYGSCFQVAGQGQMDPLVSSIVQLSTGRDAKSGKTGSCAGVDVKSCSMGITSSPPSCPVEKTKTQIDALFNKFIGVTTVADCCAKGKMSLLQEANKELGCISESNNLLASQIKSLQATLDQNFQQAEKDLSQIDTVVGDRVSQTQFIQTKLGGDKDNGNGGLLKLQADMQKVITGDLPVKVKAFEDSITAYNQQQVIFQQRVQNQKMALAKQCIATPDARYQCSVNSTTACSFSDLIEAKYYELSRTVNGQIQRNNKSNQAQAQSKKAALDALLQTIFGNMASDTKLVATTQQEAQTQQQQAGDIYQIKTPQDIQSLYATQLAAFNLPGFDVQQMFLNKFEQCYEQADSTVTSSMSDSTSQYSLSVAFMEKQKKDIRDGFTQFYKGYGDMYTQFWSTMGVTAPLNTSKCSDPSTPVAGMLQCAKDLSTNLEGAYTGNTPNSMVTIQVKGNSTNPVTAFSFSCYGVNGCVTVMQNATTNLKNETQKLDQYKKNYIQQANHSLEQLKTQMQQTLSVQNQALAKRLETLKTSMASAGVTDPLQIQYLQKEAMTKTKAKDSAGNEYDGLYARPTNLLAMIGADMQPNGMIDPTSSTFDSARSAIAQMLSSDQSKDSEIMNMLSSLNNAKAACENDALKKREEQVVAQTEQLVSCAKSEFWCNSNTKGLSEISDVLGKLDVESKPLALTQAESNLTNGLEACKTTTKNRGDLEAAVNTDQDALNKCTAASASANGNCALYETQLRQDKRDLAAIKDQSGQYQNCSGITAKLRPAVMNLQTGGDDSGLSGPAN